MTRSYWGGWFPEGPNLSYWGGWFPEGAADVGLAPAGSATFALTLEQAQVTYAWRTGLFKSYSGLERRSNIVDDPAQRYEGSAVLVGNNTRATRSRLAKYAALGRPFLLGLAYEQLTLRASAVGSTLYVYSTARSDWAIPGGRVIVRHKTHGDAERVILSVTADTLVLDSAPGNPGLLGGVVMPAMAVYLDPTQGFDRYPTKDAVERWQIRARNAIAGFATPEARASLAVPGLTGVTIYARTIGASENDITVAFAEDGGALGNIVEDTGLRTIVVHYDPAGSPLGRLATMFATSTLAYIEGAAGLTPIGFASSFAATTLAGGVDFTHAEVGRGAVVNEFAGRPLWDRGIDVKGVASDSMQSMAQPEDFGGLPFNAGMASVPDWGRSLVMANRPISAGTESQFQWVKRFLDTIKGRWRTFWLATWRPDLMATASGVGTLTVTAGENAGDFFAWWPTQEYLQIQQVDGTLTYVRISAANQVGSEIVLDIVDEDDDPVTLSGSAVRMVSWLERVRLEGDDVAIQFSGWSFTLSTVARVIQQENEGATGTLADCEGSVEESQPREGIEITVNAGTLPVVYRIATGTRDVTINGALFRAASANRGEVRVAAAANQADLVITLPLSHAVPQRYLQSGVPPRSIEVNVWRRQGTPDEDEIIHRGHVTSMAVNGHTASLLVPARLSRVLARRLPTVTAGRMCPHILYDLNCRVDRDDFKLTATVTFADGRTVRVVSTYPDGFATFGELLHVPTGERVTILEQTTTGTDDVLVTMQLPIPGITIGDTVEIYAGCAHTISACRSKFDNVPNFGGFPHMQVEGIFGLFTVKASP